MKKDLKQAIEEYNKTFCKNESCNDDIFYLPDIVEIKELSTDNLYIAIRNALEAGFMLGYRKGKNRRYNDYDSKRIFK